MQFPQWYGLQHSWLPDQNPDQGTTPVQGGSQGAWSARCWRRLPFFAGILAIGMMQPAFAQSSGFPDASRAGDAIQISPILFNAPPPPANQGAPSGRRTGGASRGNCLNYEGLTALVPVTERMSGSDVASLTDPVDRVSEEIIWGQTTAANPTLWFYVPTGFSPDQPMELVVQDTTDQYIALTTFEAEAPAGIVAMQIFAEPDGAANPAGTTTAPDSSAALPVGDLLPWTFSIYCNPDRPATFVSVRGSLERVTVEGVAPFSGVVDVEDKARSLSLARTYAAAGIWHDALTIVATLRQAYPADAEINDMWTALLQQIELESLADEPIQDCCAAKQ